MELRPALLFVSAVTATFAFAAKEAAPAAVVLPATPGAHRKLVCPKDAGVTFDLWLPKAYAEKPEARFPVLFLSSPSGRPGFLGLEKWAEKTGVILVAINESKNGPWEPIIKAQEAVLDAVSALRVDSCLRFATGASGGGWASLRFVTRHPRQFAGVILQGHSGNGDGPPPAPIAVGFCSGSKDTTQKPEVVHAAADKFRAAGRYVQEEHPDMGHNWAPVGIVTRMLDNMLVYARIAHPGVSPATRAAALAQIDADIAAAAKGDTAAASRLDPVVSVEEFKNKPFHAKALSAWSEAKAKELAAMDDMKAAFEAYADDTVSARLSDSGAPAAKALLRQFSTDSALRDELVAFDEFRKLRESHRTASARSGFKAEVWRAKFKKLAEKYAGTVAAKKAAVLAGG